MAIERIGFEITSNADQILRQLQQIDNQIRSLSRTRAAVTIDDKNLVQANSTITQLDKQIASLNAQKASLLVDYEQAVGASQAADNLISAFGQVEQSATSAGASTESAFSRIGSALSTAGDAFSSVGGTLDSIGSKMLNLINPLDGVTSSLLAQLSAWSLIQNAISFVGQNLDSAVSRYSTLQRYPNVLAALGFDEETINASSNALTKYVSNNPIKLDDLVNITKRISTITDDLGTATDAAIALNNAFLANGTSSKDRMRATEQYLQMLSTGDVDVRSWRTLEETLQVPLKYLAQYFGLNQSRDIYRQIQDGKLSFIDLQNALIELAGEGGVLADLAQTNMKGLDTSLELLANSYSVALAGIIDQVDQLLVRTTGVRLDEFVDKIREQVYNVSGAIEDFLMTADPLFERFLAFFENVKARFMAFDWSAFRSGLVEGATNIYEGFKALADRLSPVFDFVKNWITNLGGGSFEKGLGLLPATLLEFSLKLKAAGKALKLAGAAFKGIGSIFSLLGNIKLAGGGLGGSGGGLWSNGGGVSGTITRGALSVVAIAGAIASIAGAVKLIDVALPDDLSGLPDKLILLGEVIGGFGLITLAIGGLVGTTSIGKGIAVAGIASVLGLAISIQQIAKAIAKIDEYVPENTNEIKRKIMAIEELLNLLPTIANPLALVERLGASLDVAASVNITRNLVKIGRALSELGEVDIPRNISRQIETINTALDAVVYRGFTQNFKDSFTAGDLQTLTNVFDSYNAIANMLVQLSSYDTSVLESSFEQIELINLALESLNSYNLADWIGAKVDNAAVTNLNATVALYGDVAKNLQALGQYDYSLISETALLTIPAINEALSLLSEDFSIWDAFVKTKTNAVAIENIADMIGAYASVATSLRDLDAYKNVDYATIADTVIPGINAVLETMSSISDTVKDFGFEDDFTAGFKSQVRSYAEIAQAVKDLQATVDLESLNTFVSQTLPVFNRLLDTLSGIGTTAETTRLFADAQGQLRVSEGSAAADVAAAALAQIQALVSVVRAVEAVDVESIQAAIEKIKQLNLIVSELSLLDATELDADAINDIKYVVRDISEIAEEIAGLSNYNISEEAVSKVTGALKALVDGLNDIAKLTNTPYAKLAVAAISQLLEAMAGLTDQFGIIGTNYAEALVLAFLDIDIPGKLEDDIVNALSKLDALAPEFTAVGDHYGDNLRTAFGKQVERLGEHVNNALANIRSLSVSFYGAGNQLGQSLVSGFSTAISGLSSAISTQVSSIQSSLNSLRVPTLNATVGTGGTVYRATGGEVFGKRGSDTVPAMLTPGEFVLRKSAVDKLGVGVVRRLNNMDIRGAYNQMFGNMNHHARIQPSVRSIVNNITNNNVTNNANITQHMTGNSQDYNISRALGKMGYA